MDDRRRGRGIVARVPATASDRCSLAEYARCARHAVDRLIGNSTSPTARIWRDNHKLRPATATSLISPPCPCRASEQATAKLSAYGRRTASHRQFSGTETYGTQKNMRTVGQKVALSVPLHTHLVGRAALHLTEKEPHQQCGDDADRADGRIAGKAPCRTARRSPRRTRRPIAEPIAGPEIEDAERRAALAGADRCQRGSHRYVGTPLWLHRSRRHARDDELRGGSQRRRRSSRHSRSHRRARRIADLVELVGEPVDRDRDEAIEHREIEPADQPELAVADSASESWIGLGEDADRSRRVEEIDGYRRRRAWPA